MLTYPQIHLTVDNGPDYQNPKIPLNITCYFPLRIWPAFWSALYFPGRVYSYWRKNTSLNEVTDHWFILTTFSDPSPFNQG